MQAVGQVMVLFGIDPIWYGDRAGDTWTARLNVFLSAIQADSAPAMVVDR